MKTILKMSDRYDILFAYVWGCKGVVARTRNGEYIETGRTREEALKLLTDKMNANRS